MRAVVRILWEDRGQERVIDAELLDRSALGAKLRVLERIPLRTYVMCNDIGLGLRGRGSVRYCNAVGRGYEIGLEFSGLEP